MCQCHVEMGAIDVHFKHISLLRICQKMHASKLFFSSRLESKSDINVVCRVNLLNSSGWVGITLRTISPTQHPGAGGWAGARVVHNNFAVNRET